MDYRKVKAASTTVPRNLNELDATTDNIYESLMVIAKRANQINAEVKDCLLYTSPSPRDGLLSRMPSSA